MVLNRAKLNNIVVIGARHFHHHRSQNINLGTWNLALGAYLLCPAVRYTESGTPWLGKYHRRQLSWELSGRDLKNQPESCGEHLSLTTITLG